jgi:hypothetical protein
MSTLYEIVLDQVSAGMCQEDFQKNPEAHIVRLNEMTNEQLLWSISDALDRGMNKKELT